MLRRSLLLALSAAGAAGAAVVGHVTPDEPLTVARIDRTSGIDRPAWRDYLARSVAAMRTDKATLAAERRPGQPVPPPPREATNGAGLSLDREAGWYASPAARAIADTVVSFQTSAGGWGKNLDRTAPPRVPGQGWTGEDAKGGVYLSQDGAGGWSFVGTIDNDATIDELRYLARVQAHVPGVAGEPYRAAARKGLRYLFQAAFPGGGWPQVYPLQGGYHDALTLNDDAMIHALALMEDAAGGQGDFAFLAPAERTEAGEVAARSLGTLLRAQVVVNGTRTIWAQQYDPLTLQPAAARNFEPVALATGESANVLRFLMGRPNPSPAIRSAIETGTAWFRAHALADVEWDRRSGDPRLVAKPGAAPLWARFYDPQTGRPIFGDRDRTVHDDVAEISLERRKGYSWFNGSGTSLLAAYDKWKRRG